MKITFNPYLCLFLPAVLWLLIATGCRLSYPGIQKQPPGGVAINDTLWFDENELTNMDWLEYLFWIKQIKPDEYYTNLPDTNVWITDYGMDTCRQATGLMLNYLRHPAYDQYPLVGITKEQAKRYASWRSDRVFEYHLVTTGIIDHHSHQDSIYHFTIDRFFRGEYATLKPIDTFRYYPHYRLPTPEEYLAAAAYSDSLAEVRQKRCLTRRCKTCLQYVLNDTLPATVHESPGFVIIPDPAWKWYCWRFHKKLPLNIRGNADELTSVPGITTREVFRENGEAPDTLIHREVNSYTGFRNVVNWRVWEP
jgi:hypothetical protein